MMNADAQRGALDGRDDPARLTVGAAWQKALFIPLRREFFDAFEAGDKCIEYRPLGPRWNDGTCWAGRPVILSCGYGKQRRLAATIVRLDMLTRSDAPLAARLIYPACQRFAAIVLNVAAGSIRAPASAEFDGAAPDPSWSGLTKAEVKEHSRRAAQAQRAAALAAYRLAHDLPESMSDATVWALCFIEQVGKGGATAPDSRSEHATRKEPK